MQVFPQEFYKLVRRSLCVSTVITAAVCTPISGMAQDNLTQDNRVQGDSVAGGVTQDVIIQNSIIQNDIAKDGVVPLADAFEQGSVIRDEAQGARFTLSLSLAVPYRIFTLNNPARMVIDFAEVDWTGFNPIAFDQAQAVTAVRVGGFRPGWSRMVLDLAEPVAVKAAQVQREETGAQLELSLVRVTQAEFDANVGTPEAARLTHSAETTLSAAIPRDPIGSGPLRVVLDPGHGGIDPGAERDGHREADLMLTFAKELREVLVEAGGFEVILTREEDVFVPLERRVSIARAMAADVFISLHADAIAEGRAEGATVYTLAERASDEASRKLAERHDRDDLLSGVDLSDQDDVIANVLLDMARTETHPRTLRFADALVGRFQSSVGMHKRPHLKAGFSVLKSADVPSVLLELGFLSSPSDREKLLSPEWRLKAAQAVHGALTSWVETEQAVAAKAQQ